jgi:ATP-dependent helicase HrpB
VIEIEGRQWPITELPKGTSPELDAVRLAEEGRNVAVFVYGKSEIENLTEIIQRIGTDAKVFPLHSQLPYEEQKKAIDPSAGKKILLTTNIFGTGLTDPSIDAVITTPYVRRLTCSDEGVPSLIIDTIVQDEEEQYAGRAGRAKPGVCISHAPPRERLRPHAPPEIQNIPLDSLVLKAAAARESFRELNKYLIHQASEVAMNQAYETLFHLELLGPEGHILPLGQRVARLGISPRWGKLIAKAVDFQKEHDVNIVSQAIDIAAVCEAEGILSGDSSLWRRFAATEKSSDLLLQLNLFRTALVLPTEQRESLGVDEVNLLRARDIQRKLFESVRNLLPDFDKPRDQTKGSVSINAGNSGAESQEEKERKYLSLALLLSHIDSVFYCSGNERGYYQYNPVGLMVGGKRTKLEEQAILSKNSMVGGSPVVIGTRFNLGVLNEWGDHKILPFLLLAHPVESAEVACLKSSSSAILLKAYNQIKGHLGQRPKKKKDNETPKLRENPSKRSQRRGRR